jgi:small subunit ribosomal protein S20
MHTKSAKKRHRQSLERRARNRATRSALKTQIKKVREAVQGGDMAAADSEARVAAKKLDLAAAKGVLHKNAAARTKSRLAQAIKAAKQKSAATA